MRKLTRSTSSTAIWLSLPVLLFFFFFAAEIVFRWRRATVADSSVLVAEGRRVIEKGIFLLVIRDGERWAPYIDIL